jgi:hypothetical protein
MRRTPPSSSGAVHHSPIPIYVFEKNEGTVSSTFIGRLIHRVPIRLTLQDGTIIDAVRYGGRFWPTYPPQTFRQKSKQWVNKGDTLYGPGYSKLKLPLEHAYLFDCDQPRGSYGW